MTVLLIFALVISFVILGLVSLVAYYREIDETNKKIEWAEKRHYTLLCVRVPRQNSKSPLAAEQMFMALHGIYRKSEAVQDHFSIEIAATAQSINFYMLVPTHLRDFIEGQVYSQYPTVEIEAVSDYSNINVEGKAIAGAELNLTKNDYFPIRTFANFDVDPLAGITGVLSKVNDGDVLAIQAVLSPIDDTWQKEGLEYVKKVKEGKSLAPPPPLYKELHKQGLTVAKEIGRDVLLGLASAPKEKEKEKKEEKKDVKLSGPEEAGLKGIEAKVVKLGYAVTLRVLAVTHDELLSRTRLESVVGSFKQFNVSNLNGFSLDDVSTDSSFLKVFRTRQLGAKPFRLNVEEIASVFHFPDASVETPNIAWAGSKKGEPPQNLPIEGNIDSSELTSFGMTSFRNSRIKFGIKQLDRLLHFYIIGKTGTGKSTLIENMIYDDIKEGRGVAVVDPHGELIDHILDFIPEERLKDVVYFNPADTEYPLAFNLLEDVQSAEMRGIVASGLMSIFTKLWAGVWSARMEYILRNAILAVLEVPNATLLSIMRVLNDNVYRKYVMSCVTDPVVKDFFVNEYDKYDAKFRQEAIAPIQNKVGQFLSSSTIRNLVGQPKSTFNLLEIMDSGKIFLVNLSIGRIGEDSSKLLGSMLITKLQLSAMSRAKMHASERREFFLYVDEFQNFATDSFATILSEARKYKLGLILVNQYIAQIPELVADAIFGNVGSMVSFRVGPTDADKLVKEFEPVFDANDLINLPNRQIYTKMAIDGVTSRPFSAHTLPPRGIATENKENIIEFSRRSYARNKVDVEREITSIAEADYRPETEKEHETIKEFPFILDGVLYKEFSAKGGQRWYFGQPPEVLEEEMAKESESEDNGGETQASAALPDMKEELPKSEPEKEKAPEPVQVPAVVPQETEKEASKPVKVEQMAPRPAAVVAVIEEPNNEVIPAPVSEASLPVLAAQESSGDIIAYEPVGLPSVEATDEEGDVPGKKKRKRKRKKKKSSEDGTTWSQNSHSEQVESHQVESPEPHRAQQAQRSTEVVTTVPHNREDVQVIDWPVRSDTSSEASVSEALIEPTVPEKRPVLEKESRGVEAEESAPKALEMEITPIVNRGHQADEWLPLEELE